eukprot:TRINITY_DN60887_c0_g1_i1.p1 TRINITY_DN60887_c0_g1~~TRINITY_DN60887_c0_g1_i1.p1  ORF type:complete len:281 (-),score=60.74 TRINITY_DN60887_c0_g1_i1:42-884(-)
MPIIKEERLGRYEPTEFKFDRVKSEVEDGMQFDFKRDQVDQAKKKAITTAPTYDEFKARVAGCHLKPIHKNEFNEAPKFQYNRQIDSRKSKEAIAPAVSASVLSKVQATSSGLVIRNSRELDRELRRRGSAQEKAAIVSEHLSSGEVVQKIFGRELDAEVFRTLLEALDEAGKDAVPHGTARQLLTDVAERCPSSAAQVAAFFTSEEHRLVARLLARDGADAANADIVRICASLGVTPASVAEAAASLPKSNSSEGYLVHDEKASHETGNAGNDVCDSMD